MLIIGKKCNTVKKVEYIDGYKLKLTFNDRSVKIVDLSGMLRRATNMLLPLRDLDYFKKVSCDGTTVVWPNGVDLCPDVLYKTGKDISLPAKRNRVSPKPKSGRRRKSKSYT
jgi:hypothetical protein